MGTLVPRNMQTAMRRALERLSERVGDIDTFVAEKLGYTREELLGTKDRTGYFSAEQVDALALAIDNVDGGAAFIIGDQTGVGKGRFVAAMLRYAMQSNRVPVFVTKDPGLYSDMVRDLRDIGMPDIAKRILVSNNGLRGEKAVPLSPEDPSDTLTSLPDAKQKAAIMQIARNGNLPEGYDAFFTTYSQMQYGPKGREIERQRALMALAPNAVIVLDESHEAGGTEGGQRNINKETGEVIPTRADFFREVLKSAQGAVYSSATYAKNPHVMSLYFRTDLSLAVDKLEDLSAAIEAGGVPLQQVVANMLVEAGQYARRERSYEGVEMTLDTLDTDTEMARRASRVLRDIFTLDAEFMEEARVNFIDFLATEGEAGVRRDNAIGDGSASQTGFAQIMHNVVSQMLLSLKTPAVAKRAIELAHAGEKPIIAVSNTNESIISDFAEGAGLIPGDRADLRFNDILERYLHRLRRISIKDPDDTIRHVVMTDEQIRDYGGPAAYARYKEVERIIREADLSAMPASPVDYLLDTLNAAGVKADEITGRGVMIQNGVYKTRKNSAAIKKRAMNAYNAGRLDALVINRSGSTGFSMHATGARGNDGKTRHMIILQPDPNIDTFMQMLGRIHRTGQIKLPKYTIAVSDLAVEKRLAAILMKKMASLNASTTASKRSAVSIDSVTDFMNKYGDEVVADLLREDTELSDLTNLYPTERNLDGLAAKLTGRLAILEPERVVQVYEQIERAYREYIDALDRMGLNTLEAKLLDLGARTKSTQTLVEAKGNADSPFAEAAIIENVNVKRLGKPYTVEELRDRVREILDGKSASAYVDEILSRIRGITPDYMAGLNARLEKVREALEAAESEKQKERAHTSEMRWMQAIDEAQSKIDQISGLIELFRPGQSLIVRRESGDEATSIPGVSLGVDARALRDNPTAASTIKVRIAIADAGREIVVPLSKFLGENPAYRAATADPQFVRRAFEEGGQEAREDRQMITGNLVAGFARFNKGQFVMYTDEAGNVRQGILMPREFDLNREMEREAVRFESAAQIAAFLEQEPGKRMVKSPDKLAAITWDGSSFNIAVLVRGGKPYFLLRPVRDIIGDFQQRRGQKTMNARIGSRAALKKVVDAYADNLGVTWETDSFKDEARAVVNPKPDGPPDGPGPRGPKAQRRNKPARPPAYRTPKFFRELQELNAALRAELDRLGLDDVELLRGMPVTGVTSEGSYYAAVIHIATTALDPHLTLRHEAIHALREFRLFTDAEWTALEAAADKMWLEQFNIAARYPNLDIEGQREEAIAEGFAHWQRGELTIGGRILRAFNKLKKYLQALANALMGRGFHRADDIMERAEEVLERVESGKVGHRSRDAMWAYLREQLGDDVVDAALKEAAADLDRVRAQTAYHGTPHDFDAFSLEHIGKGEGVQAYGWGLYFAGKRAVAEYYRDNLSRNPDVYLNGSRLDDQYSFLAVSIRTIHDDVQAGVDFETARDRVLDDLRHRLWLVEDREREDAAAEIREAIAAIGPMKADDFSVRKGRLYTVELTPKEDEYLYWDRPLREQSEKVRAAFRDLGVEEDAPVLNTVETRTGRDAYRRLAFLRGGEDRAASLALRDAGIPGIKYLDGSTRNAAPVRVSVIETGGQWRVVARDLNISRTGGSENIVADRLFQTKAEAEEFAQAERDRDRGSYNYVIFDDSLVEIRGKAQVRDVLGAAGRQRRYHVLDAKERTPEGGITIVERDDVGDLNPVKRWLYTPAAAFKRWPELRSLQQFGVRTEVNLSRFNTRLQGEFDHIKARLGGGKQGDERFQKLSDVLFLGDAEERTFTTAELQDEFGISDEIVIAAYHDMRKLIERLGRFVDQHRRAMQPTLRARKAAVLKRMATLRRMDDPEFRKLYTRRQRLRQKLRSGNGNPEKIAAQIDEIEQRLDIVRQGTGEYQELAQELDRIDAALAQTSVRRRKGYVPHKFFGTWAVYRVTEDAEGEPVMSLVAGDNGFFPSRDAAVKGAGAYLDENPGAELVVRPVQFSFPASDATALTDAAYWRFVRRVSEAMEVKGDELHDMIRGVARRRFRRRIASFAQFRSGVEGYSRDLDAVMRTHIGEVVRYVMLDKLKYRAINTMERMGLSPHRSYNPKTETLQRAVDAWLRDVNGQKQPVERAIDELLDKPWATPLRSGLAVGTVAFSTFGLAGSPGIGALLGTYLGARTYFALRDAGDFKTRAVTGAMLTDMAHLKLGAFFNLFSAVVNMTQTAVNTTPVLGRYALTGMRLLESAWVSAKIKKEPNRYWRLIERADIATKFKYSEVNTHQFSKVKRIQRASLFLFDTAEQFNRAVSFLGAYQRAIDRGASEGQAFREGEAAMVRTQHHYGAANKPEVLRGVLTRIPGQFKNFMFQQIAFIAGLDRRSELPAFLLALFLVAGGIGLPGIDLIDMLIDALTDWSPIAELKKAALDLQAKGEAIGVVANVLLRGLPTLIGEDMSARAGAGDKFLPLELRDYQGPWVSTISQARALAEMNATIGDHIRNLSSGAGRPLKSIEAMANGLPLQDAILNPGAFYQALTDDRIVYTNPWKDGALEYDERTLSRTDLARMAVGSTPLKVAQQRDVTEQSLRLEERHAKKSGEVLRSVVDAYRRYYRPNDRRKLRSAIQTVAERASAEGITLTKQQLDNAIEKAVTPRILRQVKNARRAVRPELFGLMQSAAPELLTPRARASDGGRGAAANP